VSKQLRIREAQMASFADAARDAERAETEREALALVERHWVARLRETPDDERRARVRALLLRAEGYGLTGVRNGLRFVNAAMALGPAFDEDARHPWAPELLRSDLPADVKAARLAEQVGLELRRRAGG
jgi:hypothetical protein